MDDGYAICKNKSEANLVLKTLYHYSELLNFELNTKKCTVHKIHKGVNWLKSYYWLTNTGKVLRKPCRDSIRREHRKLKRFSRISRELTEISYNSWKSWLKNCNSYNIIYKMNTYKNKVLEVANGRR